MRNRIIKNNKFIFFLIVQTIAALITTEIFKNFAVNNNNSLIIFLLSLSFYIVIYILPIMFFLRFISKENILGYLKLNSNVGSGIIRGLAIGAFIFMILLIKNRLVINRQLYLPADLVVILGKVLVGPLEEMPFRGFYLQKLEECTSFWKANFISSFIFALIHLPNFINGTFDNLFPLIVIMGVSLWLGFIFKETKSLWCVAIVHSLYDLALWTIL